MGSVWVFSEEEAAFTAAAQKGSELYLDFKQNLGLGDTIAELTHKSWGLNFLVDREQSADLGKNWIEVVGTLISAIFYFYFLAWLRQGRKTGGRGKIRYGP